jgi:hypothetical protein
MVKRMLRHTFRALSWLAVTTLLVTDYVSSGVRPEIATVAAWRIPVALEAAQPANDGAVLPTEQPNLNPVLKTKNRLATHFAAPVTAVDLHKFDSVALPMELAEMPDARLVEHWDDVSLCIPLGHDWTFDMAYRHGENDTVLDPLGNPIFGSLAGTVQNIEPAMENFVVGFRLNF